MTGHDNSNKVEDFYLSVDVKDNNKSRSISIFGYPLHCTPDALKEKFLLASFDDFLASEARYGIGNYVVMLQEGSNATIITSTSYCGGYFRDETDGMSVGTTLVSVLPREPRFDSFGLCFALAAQPKSAFGSMPITTPFEGIRRLPPAAVLKISGAKLAAFYSYLYMGRDLNVPRSFESALKEVAQTVASRSQTPVVMFSGGVDSLVISLALAQVVGRKSVRAVTMQTAVGRSETNGHRRALPVARKSGLEIEVLPDRCLYSDAVISSREAMMRQDMIGSRAPHLALIDYDVSGPIFHGQNMDATAMNSMTVLQFNLERGYLSGAIAGLINDKNEPKQNKTFIENMQFTQAYLGDKGFQVSTAKTYGRWRKGEVDPDPGGAGILRGLLSSQFPNVLPAPAHPASLCSMLDACDREAALYRGFATPRLETPEYVADAARFYTYSHLAAKRLSTFSLPSGSAVQLLAMAGPIVSYFLGRPKGLREASQPKREIYGLAKRLAGLSYSQLSRWEKQDEAALQKLPLLNASHDLLMDKNRQFLNPNSSRLIDAIVDTNIKDRVVDFYVSNTSSKALLDPTNISSQVIINLEMVLDEASRKSR